MAPLFITKKDKLKRTIWSICYFCFFKTSPIFAHRWRVFLLNLFGANVSYKAFIYPDVKIWSPWNLVMQEDSTLAFGVICYNPALVSIGRHSTVSQFTHLCTAGHDYEHPDARRSAKFPLMVGPIIIGNHVWITADCFISPDVKIDDWVVVLPRSVVTKSISDSVVVGGAPAVPLRKRVVREE
ncbi:MAG: hypothetical protein A0129_15015 [Limnobacter sp. CACIAM 66H1]|uniref:putative colanic acid biosynthesis acetyltransferase n=1 Tax=Limnobacter sp. CACIAM 66H1 TaxID=1813033 RepID=UPI0007A90F67|nr:putative colanic acid biosynthesis acetyltransferase [Limnobacter sp. CACIAM 66H1]KYP10060.1 MAG: hypothetical protein A0129_15015 [Limnobacter sp. CACIAM 66H1]